jgi:DNA mismatch endonuclease (patch repair protein)
MTVEPSKEMKGFDMSRIKGKDTKPEILVRKFLHANGFRYKLHDKSLPGKPDIVLRKYNAVIFVNGCFWHGHTGCKLNRIPKNNQEYWIPKITGNVKRDKMQVKRLKKEGWHVIVIWECTLRAPKTENSLQVLLKTLQNFL